MPKPEAKALAPKNVSYYQVISFSLFYKPKFAIFFKFWTTLLLRENQHDLNDF